MNAIAVHLDLLPQPVALCQLPPREPFPAWVDAATQFLSISRTPAELSIVADERAMPHDLEARRGYRVLRVQGPLAFELVGIMASLAGPLAEAQVSIFPIATVDTDYLLLHESDLKRAVVALEMAGHTVHR